MLGALLNIVGSTVLVIWTATVISQIILRRRADRAGEQMPMRMWGFPWLSWAALVLLAVIIALAMIDPTARVQLLLTLALTAALLGLARLTRGRSRRSVIPEPDDAKVS